jgi:hypothetical protein
MNLICMICKTLYDADSHLPLVLGCGHSFCKSCLESEFKNGLVKCILEKHFTPCNSVGELMVNQGLLAAVKNKKHSENSSALHSQASDGNIFESQCLLPCNLNGIFDYIEDARYCIFAVENINCNGTVRKVVGLRIGHTIPKPMVPEMVNPVDLLGLEEDYYTDIGLSRFCWRYATGTSDLKFRVVTIENDPLATTPIKTQFGKITPDLLSGTNDYSDASLGLNFYWRWATLNNGSYKVLTLE